MYDACGGNSSSLNHKISEAVSIHTNAIQTPITTHINTNTETTSDVKLAFAVQGNNTQIIEWIDMIHKMHYKHHITLFYLSYFGIVDTSLCDNVTVFCMYRPHTTWTSGRNQLVQRISQYENTTGNEFKYWTFADTDMVRLEACGDSSKCHGDLYPPNTHELTGCCFDGIVNMLMSPEVQYAEINYIAWAGKIKHVSDYPAFAHQDCADGALNSFHRRAVPVILPYVELVDNKTWWESQGMHFLVTMGCYPGYSVVSNIMGNYQHTNDHTSYPNGRNHNLAKRAMSDVYGSRGLMNYPITAKHMQNQGNCARHDDTHLFEHWMDNTYESPIKPHPGYDKDGYQKIKTEWKTDVWMNSTRFMQCYDALLPRFLKFVEIGNLTEIDGPNF